MTEWDKLTVALLKEECKSRKISLTGLKLKQHFIDKLVEYDASTSQEPLAEDEQAQSESLAERTNGVFEEGPKDDAVPEAQNGQTPSPKLRGGSPEEVAEDTKLVENIPLAIEADANLPADRPATLKIEDSQASEANDDGSPERDGEADTPKAETAAEAENINANDMLVPTSEQLQAHPGLGDRPASNGEDVEMGDAESTLKEELKERAPTPIALQDSSKSTPSTAEDSRKRKRRSATPSLEAEEVQKKAKISSDTAVVTKTLSPSSRSRTASPQPGSGPSPSHAQHEQSDDTAEGGNSETGVKGEAASKPDRQSSEGPDQTVEPAIHAATRSLYMRNFKRPLNIQTLKSHVLTVAQGSSAVTPGEDPIKSWYINNIRSHVFATFSSISAASRVRANMHKTRFPDEPSRDPLFIDFVPDDKIETWIDQETSSSRGSRNSAAKLEVFYDPTDDGIEAVFREADAFARPQRPSIQTSDRSSFARRQSSYSADPSKTATIAAGLHPDRADLMPESPGGSRRRLNYQDSRPQKRSNDEGIGFQDLDSLFESTATKPKLYFKRPSQDVIDDRLDMMKSLYTDRGVSGDPGMKRYTFEKDARGREDWVDNGPEFGHGKRGIERLTGRGRGGGGYRGRGRGFSGDSYRGGGRR